MTARRSLAAGVALLSALGLGSSLADRPAPASSRPYRPLGAAIAEADVIVGARVLVGATGPPSGGNAPGRVEVTVLRVLKGAPPAARLTVTVRTFEQAFTGRLAPGSEHVLFLARAEPAGPYRLVDAPGVPYREPDVSRLADAIDRMPAWSDAPEGLAAVLVSDHEPAASGPRDLFRYRSGDAILLWAGYRNVSGREIVLRYRDWPLESHTHWTLRVERVGGGPVAAVPHPHVDAAGIRAFFSRNAHRFDLPLRPGEAFFLFVDRINSAEPGWGYKERLDFRFYPMAVAGEYEITGVGRHYHAGVPIVTRALRLQMD